MTFILPLNDILMGARVKTRGEFIMITKSAPEFSGALGLLFALRHVVFDNERWP
jgi:hypothetical protein